MARYAFDIDGTLTQMQIRDLARHLYDAGHTIYIITGGLARYGITEEDQQKRIKEREKQLRELGVKYHKLFVCIGKDTKEVAMQKATVCATHKPVIIFEDTPKYINAIEKHSNTVGLLVGKTKRKPYY
jgi:DNA-binding LacI/PurR family transcriptional regulator